MAVDAAAESTLWADCLLRDAERDRSSVFSPLGEARYALGLETIYEGYLVHYGRPRLFAPPDDDTALLLGDYLYAHGVARISALHDVAAVADLSELISLCSQLRAEETDGDGPLWAATAALLGRGALDEARTALRLHADPAAARRRPPVGGRATTRSTQRSRRTPLDGLEPCAPVRQPLLMTTAVREERKVLTAVFADVVGSTALAERLDPEDVKLVVGEAVARIVGEVESLGGHVKDLAGDGVLAFFGAPTTREDDAERAVRCALRIVGEMEEYAREVRRGWGVEGFGVRVGAATGAVVVGEVGAGCAGRVRRLRRHRQRRGAAAVGGRSRAPCSSTTRRIARSRACSSGASGWSSS